MNKKDLIALLEIERDRVEHKIKRRQDDMPDWEAAALSERRNTLNYVLIVADELNKAAA